MKREQRIYNATRTSCKHAVVEAVSESQQRWVQYKAGSREDVSQKEDVEL